MPRHGLLPEVTAFDEIDRAGVAADLLGQVLLRDVLAENRRTRLDAKHLENLRPAFDQPGFAVS